MKRLIFAILVAISVNIASCDKEQQEKKQWQRYYMPLSDFRNDDRSWKIMLVVSILC